MRKNVTQKYKENRLTFRQNLYIITYRKSFCKRCFVKFFDGYDSIIKVVRKTG